MNKSMGLIFPAGQDDNRSLAFFNNSVEKSNQIVFKSQNGYCDTTAPIDKQGEYNLEKRGQPGEKITDNAISFHSTALWIILVLFAYFIVITIIPGEPRLLIMRYLEVTTILLVTIFYMVEKKRGILVYLFVFFLAFSGYYIILQLPVELYSYVGSLVDIHTSYYFSIIAGVAYVGYQIRRSDAWKAYFIYLAKVIITMIIFESIIKITTDLCTAWIKSADPYFMAGQYELEAELANLSRIILTVALSFFCVYLVEKKQKFYNSIFVPVIIGIQVLVFINTIFAIIVLNFYFISFEQGELSNICKLIFQSIVLSTLFVFSKSSNSRKTVFDYFIYYMIIFTWEHDLLMIVIILHRIYSQITPARVVGVISLVMFLILLSGYIYYYSAYLFCKKGMFQFQQWICHFIPVFTIWFLIFARVIPIIFKNFPSTVH